MTGRYGPYWPALREVLDAGLDLESTGVDLVALAETVVTERRVSDWTARRRQAALLTTPELGGPRSGRTWHRPDQLAYWQAEALLDDHVADRAERALPHDVRAAQEGSLAEFRGLTAGEDGDSG